jgi:hypothetical protein
MLRSLVTSAQQNNQRLPVFSVRHAVTASNIHPQFGYAFTHRLAVAKLPADTRRGRTSICARARASRKPRSHLVTGVLSSLSLYRRNSIMVYCSF